MQELSGAGGNWRVIDEIVDANVVQQQDNLSCGPACGEMLLRNRGVNDIDRYASASESGVPVSPQVLASVLNALYKMDLEEFLNYWTLFAVYRAG
ncbi:hypothetical protein QT971_16890 [Microcoleus sp. herbarium19]|uniref:hypothetical protein n=1 Tax=unclassified Microcoleus TaxID=2642155 RepID=UPI002FD6BFAD